MTAIGDRKLAAFERNIGRLACKAGHGNREQG